MAKAISESGIGVTYNIPKVGLFKGIPFQNLVFAVVPMSMKTQADQYLKATTLRSYKTDNYMLYVTTKGMTK